MGRSRIVRRLGNLKTALLLITGFFVFYLLFIDRSPKNGQEQDQQKTNNVVTTPVVDTKKENAAFVTIAGNEDLWVLGDTIRSVEDRFNKHHHYDWVFLNHKEKEIGGFSDEFKAVVSNLASGKVKFGNVGPQEWSIPGGVEKKKLFRARSTDERKFYDDPRRTSRVTSYRHWNRFFGGLLYKHPLLADYKYYWKLETQTGFTCDIKEDPFRLLREQGVKFGTGFATNSYLNKGDFEDELWSLTKNFIKENPQYVASDNLLDFISDDAGDTLNTCHFLSTFEIGDMDFWRSEAFKKYFNTLESNFAFYYHPISYDYVHTLAASLFLPKSQVHHFDNIGFTKSQYKTCPLNKETRTENACLCDGLMQMRSYAKDTSCLTKFYHVKGLNAPDTSLSEAEKQHVRDVERERGRPVEEVPKPVAGVSFAVKLDTNLRKKKAPEPEPKKAEIPTHLDEDDEKVLANVGKKADAPESETKEALTPPQAETETVE